MQKTIVLTDKIDTKINPSSPFSFDGTFHKPSHFPTPDNHYEDGIYWQSFRFNEQFYGLKFSNTGTIDVPEFLLSIYYDDKDHKPLPDVDAIVKEISYRFDLQSDLQAFTKRFSDDAILGPAIQRWRGMRVSTPYSFYEFTVVTTVLQNTIISRTVQMMANLFRTYGRIVSFDSHELSAFWSPLTIHQTEEAELRTLKLGYRAKTLKRQAEDFISGEVDVSQWRLLEKETLKKKLLKMYGIGPATVEYVLFEVFHHYDALEHIPPWEQKIYSRLLFDQELVETSTILEELDSRYGKWKKLAIHYIFENLFWLRKHEDIRWLEELIRL